MRQISSPTTLPAPALQRQIKHRLIIKHQHDMALPHASHKLSGPTPGSSSLSCSAAIAKKLPQQNSRPTQEEHPNVVSHGFQIMSPNKNEEMEDPCTGKYTLLNSTPTKESKQAISILSSFSKMHERVETKLPKESSTLPCSSAFHHREVTDWVDKELNKVEKEKQCHSNFHDVTSNNVAAPVSSVAAHTLHHDHKLKHRDILALVPFVFVLFSLGFIIRLHAWLLLRSLLRRFIKAHL